MEYLEKRMYDELIEEIMVNYYDKSYKKENEEFELLIHNEDSKQAAAEIYEFYKELI